MRALLADAARTLVPPKGDPHGPLPPLMLVLTVVTGLVDAVSYLGLGHVFVANMTGNVVFLGFALAEAEGLSALASVVSLTAFLTGALAGGRFGVRFGTHRGRLLASGMTVQAVLVAGALVVALAGHDRADAAFRYPLIVLLGLSMGLQNATVRRLGVPDLTTTVLTRTLTGLAADSGPVGGTAPRPGRRALSVLAMFLGALAGAALLSVGLSVVLGAVLALLAAGAAVLWRVSAAGAVWAAAP
ncbi:YoaK family protein [Streptomyces showdoensis]|uniref:Membrane protein n=1 Tax=Streptomyces showdoensis TaxID=68268 RepID=A0A2P2GUM2_STREW|nr:YoaK family protein [Streptomyces showdoensis]KKZ75180.1 membrane protein [Streptomyces showdoensis]